MRKLKNKTYFCCLMRIKIGPLRKILKDRIMTNEEIKTLMKSFLDEAIGIYEVRKASFGDGVTKNGDRAVMLTKIYLLSQAYSALLGMLSLNLGHEIKWQIFKEWFEDNAKVSEEFIKIFKP